MRMWSYFISVFYRRLVIVSHCKFSICLFPFPQIWSGHCLISEVVPFFPSVFWQQYSVSLLSILWLGRAVTLCGTMVSTCSSNCSGIPFPTEPHVSEQECLIFFLIGFLKKIMTAPFWKLRNWFKSLVGIAYLGRISVKSLLFSEVKKSGCGSSTAHYYWPLFCQCSMRRAQLLFLISTGMIL